MAPITAGRKGLTQTQKYELCLLRSRYPDMKLVKFAELPECPKRQDGRPLALSSLSEHLRGWKDRVQKGKPKGPEAQKQKTRKAQYPIFEFLLAKWVDAAEEGKVPVTDDVLRAQSLVIQEKLIEISCEEDYADFAFSGGWLRRFKERHMIGRLKRHGEAGSVNSVVVESAKEEIQESLRHFALKDIWNCDESGLQYNKQPAYSNVRKENGKVLEGVKLDKTRITTFHTVNADGTEKKCLTVIGRAETPQAFRRNRININNLPIIYRYNKKAWMLSGLWYEYLRNFDQEMRIQRRNIILITDNCPSHPHPNSPPENYEGPAPPVLTNITLLYLPPNTTSKLQPLDQGIIAAFKAAYRRQYADYMVQYFNRHSQAPPKLNILSAIYLMADAWESIPSSTISNCWKRAGLLGSRHSLTGNSDFLSTSTAHTRSALRALNPGLPEAELDQRIQDYLRDESVEDAEDLSNRQAILPDSGSLVEEYVNLGLLTRNIDDMETTYLDAEGDPDDELEMPPLQLLSHTEAIQSLHHVSRYLQSLPVSSLSTATGRKITLSTMVEQSTFLASAIHFYQESQKKQTTIDSFFTRIPSQPRSLQTTYPQVDPPRSMSLRSDRQSENQKGKEPGPPHRLELSEEQSTTVQGGLLGLGAEGREGDSVTEDEEELGEAGGSGSCERDGGQTRRNMYPHPYDSQDLNLYPSQYDHGFSQTYANLLH